ncbi:Membrane cofactor protein [Orchesella cincta]|uniref:Membrane cofactor protein n=1 Tax=Orchesella cincta TaxID=48709 RepID=A0A1D2N6U2_ORCCI|nr:Membrane cofactor protein [Orchesella cincta]
MRNLECGPPAQVPSGRYTLLNGTRSYKSMVRYSCDEGYAMVGRNDLMCDLDQRWNGPPPRCEALICPDPPTIRNGDYEITERFGNSFTVLYKCNAQFRIVGEEKITCNEGSYDKDPPECRKRSASTKAPVVPPVKVAANPSSRKPSPSTSETPPPEITPSYEGGDDVGFGGEGQGNEDQYQHVDANQYPQEPEEDGHDESKDRPVTTGASDSDDLAGEKEDKTNGDVPDNDVSESNQIVKERKPGVDFPKNVEVHATESSAVARLNIGKEGEKHTF